MCSRFYIQRSTDLIPYTEKAEASPLNSKMSIALSRPLKKEGEIKPTDMVPVIAPSKTGKETVFPMVWGFTNPRSTAPIINARVETVAGKPMFRDSWEHRRCVIPCSWYFEWEHLHNEFTGKDGTGDKYTIQPKGTSVTFLAGLYRIENGFPYFTILTMNAADNIRFIHDRMPVILPHILVNEWITPNSKAEAIVAEALTDVVFEKSDCLL